MPTLTLPRAETVAHELLTEPAIHPNTTPAQALALVQAVYACVERCTIQSVVVESPKPQGTQP